VGYLRYIFRILCHEVLFLKDITEVNPLSCHYCPSIILLLKTSNPVRQVQKHPPPKSTR